MKIRDAKLSDAQTMLDIYAHYIQHTAISFELEIPSLEDFSSRITKIISKYPWIVCEEDQNLLGYAYAGTFRERLAYQWTTEATVYLRQDVRGRGVGKLLYTDLLKRLKQQGFVNVIGGITLPNEASVRLHETCGFTKIANISDAGFKFEKWWDVGYWQLQFDRPEKPAPLKVPMGSS
jgi:L-amino acid N-acyltransferase YncA